MKWFLHLALILAFVTAGISPACAFVGGKTSIIELCAPDGSVKQVEVPADMDPFAKPAPHENGHHVKSMMDDCAFCFAGAQGKGLSVAYAMVIKAPLPAGYVAVGSGTAIPLSLDFSSFQPRAPPFPA